MASRPKWAMSSRSSPTRRPWGIFSTIYLADAGPGLQLVETQNAQGIDVTVETQRGVSSRARGDYLQVRRLQRRSGGVCAVGHELRAIPAHDRLWSWPSTPSRGDTAGMSLSLLFID